MPCSECPSKENLAPVGVHRIQAKCGYPCLTPNALLRIAVCSVQARKCCYSEYDIWASYTKILLQLEHLVEIIDKQDGKCHFWLAIKLKMLRKLFLLNLKTFKWSWKPVKSIFWQLRKTALVIGFWQGVLTKIIV